MNARNQVPWNVGSTPPEGRQVGEQASGTLGKQNAAMGSLVVESNLQSLSKISLNSTRSSTTPFCEAWVFARWGYAASFGI